MDTHVEFRSDRFPPYEGEEDVTNPGRYGKRLAEFVAAGIREHGFESSEPIAEDWGWVVTIQNQAFRFWIGCGNYEEYDDGFLCFIEPSKPYIWRFIRRIHVQPKIEVLRRALDAILTESAGIREKRWWTYEEFNFVKR